ncbi:DNA-binding transcriptional LysR family regulator [Altererythrobacter atlanticus]|uniref:LysR family transcriptional regulator n=1 Tax=Croceibacterium atlanticum TaxID=1267766 RepID=UPI0006B33D2D|nr:LysR family transcriptional regulator [Croceibacterium atlanticum]MBB5731686.1 DNA-binding transcriptional LysR family regulator [Croceibacterium atlanticum]
MLRLAVLINQGGFRKAAKELHITQPALSQSIAQLEEEVGVQLITRSAHGVEPTIYGEALYAHARTIDRELAQATQQIESLMAGGAGSLLAGATTGGGIHIVARAAANLKSSRPDTKMFILEESLVDALVRQLRDRVIDLFVCQNPADFDLKGLKAFRIFQSRKLLCARKGHPLEGTGDLRGFMDYTLILPPDEMGILSSIKTELAASGLEIHESNILVSNSIYAAKEIVSNTDCWSVFSDNSIIKEREQGSLVAYDLPECFEGWNYLVVRAEYSASSLAKSFIREIFQVCELWGLPVHRDAISFERTGRVPGIRT